MGQLVPLQDGTKLNSATYANYTKVGGCLQVARGGKMRRDVTSSAKFVTRFMVWRGGSVCVQIIYTGLSEVAVGFDD